MLEPPGAFPGLVLPEPSSSSIFPGSETGATGPGLSEAIIHQAWP